MVSACCCASALSSAVTAGALSTMGTARSPLRRARREPVRSLVSWSWSTTLPSELEITLMVPFSMARPASTAGTSTALAMPAMNAASLALSTVPVSGTCLSEKYSFQRVADVTEEVALAGDVHRRLDHGLDVHLGADVRGKDRPGLVPGRQRDGVVLRRLDGFIQRGDGLGLGLAPQIHAGHAYPRVDLVVVEGRVDEHGQHEQAHERTHARRHPHEGRPAGPALSAFAALVHHLGYVRHSVICHGDSTRSGHLVAVPTRISSGIISQTLVKTSL